MKILFTSVGRRVELMQAFRKATNELNVDLTIIGTDIVTDAPALQFCDESKMVCRMLIKDFRPCGQITVQLIRDEVTGADYYIEINPRFGGGAPLSMKAGADSAKAVIRMLCGESLEYVEKAAKDGAVYSRFDQSVYVG